MPLESVFAAYGLPGEPGSREFWAAAAGPGSVPAGDGGWTTLFLWRGSAADLTFESWSQDVPLRRWRDTDCWYAEVPMPARLRVTYRFLVGGTAYADPLNPVGAGGGPVVGSAPRPPGPRAPGAGGARCPTTPPTREREGCG
ncbi:enterochelin esterase, partial [Streptomyces sp. NPDC059538]